MKCFYFILESFILLSNKKQFLLKRFTNCNLQIEHYPCRKLKQHVWIKSFSVLICLFFKKILTWQNRFDLYLIDKQKDPRYVWWLSIHLLSKNISFYYIFISLYETYTSCTILLQLLLLSLYHVFNPLTQIKFVVLLTFNHTILIMLVQRI